MDNEESLMELDPYTIPDKIRNGELFLCERYARSKVWEIFSLIQDKDGVEVKDYTFCKVCERVLRVINNQTSNLVKHKCYLERFKKKDASSLQSQNTSLADEVGKAKLKVDVNPVVNLTNLLTRWIVKDCRPYNLINNENVKSVFQELAKLGSKYGSDIDVDSLLPSVPAIAENISIIYEECFENVKVEIASVKDNGFGLTTNIWTDNFTKQTYIVLTIHYLINSVLKFRLLGMKVLEYGKSTNQHVAEKVNELLDTFECKLSSKTIIVCDGDCDIINAFPGIQTLPCISKLLCNALQRSIKDVPEVTEIISACLKLVKYLRNIEHNTLVGDQLQTSYTNRWINTYKMLNSVERNWNEIEETLLSKNEKSRILAINMNHLKTITKIFQPFEEAIETLEDDSYATLHLVMVYLHELKKTCDASDNEFVHLKFIERLKESIRLNIDQIVAKNVKIMHKLALFLYPPTNKLLQFSDIEKECVEKECVRLMRCFNSELKPTIKQEPNVSTVCKRRKLFSDFVESEASSNPNELIMQEIQYYKNTRVINSPDFDVFNWWELQRNNFPLLYKLSCAVLATPACSAPSKRTFSAAGSLLCEKTKNYSKEAEIEKIVFIKSNAKHDELETHFSV